MVSEEKRRSKAPNPESSTALRGESRAGAVTAHREGGDGSPCRFLLQDLVKALARDAKQFSHLAARLAGFDQGGSALAALRPFFFHVVIVHARMLNPFRGWRQAVYFVEKGLTAIPAWRSIHASPHDGATEETMAANPIQPKETPSPLAITKDLLRSWSACGDGYKWFVGKFPQGGGFHEVNRALVADKRYDDSRWLADKAFAAAMQSGCVKDAVTIVGADAERIATDVREIAATATGDAATTGEGANAATTGDWANAATTGYRANAATTGDWANAATTGEWANAATTGEGANAATTGEGANAATMGGWANAATTGEGANAATMGGWANAATTGYRANAATTGDWANAATTGDWANAATTGEGANAATTGKNSIAACLGMNGKAMAGPDGCIAVAWLDANSRPRLVVGYVGEDGIKDGVWYCAKGGSLVEVVE